MNAVLNKEIWHDTFFLSLLISIAFFTATNAQVSEIYEPPHRYFIVSGVEADDVLNIREGPGASFQIVGEFDPSEALVEVLAVSQNERWALVNVVEGVGWTSMNYLRPIFPPTYRPTNVPIALKCNGSNLVNWSAFLGDRGVFFSVLGLETENFLINETRTYRNPDTVTLIKNSDKEIVFDVLRSAPLCANEAGNLFPWSVDIYIGSDQFNGCCSLDW